MYPVQRLIHHTLGTTCKHKARKLLAERLANKNRSKAYNLAERLLSNPVISYEHALRLHHALELPKDTVLKAVQAAFLQCEEDHRLSYLRRMGPHLQVSTRGPVTSALFASMMHQKLKVVQLPLETTQFALRAQLQHCRDTVSEYRKEYGSHLPIFGEITGFNYCPVAGSQYELDTEGGFVRRSDCLPRAPDFSVKLGGKHYDWSTIPSFF